MATLLPLELRLCLRHPISVSSFSALHVAALSCKSRHYRYSTSQPSSLDQVHPPPPPPQSQLQSPLPQPSLDYLHLNPPPTSYSITPFTDRCQVTLHTGAGGHGCVSFLREKYIAEGPPNGGDGGTGGSIYIQAVRGETSLHRLSRRPILKAGRGANGKGKGKGGARGEDLLITVPVGTVVREVERYDPVAEEERVARERKRLRKRATRAAAAAHGSPPGDSLDAETIPASDTDVDVDADSLAAIDEEEALAREKFIIFPGPLTGRDIRQGEEAGPPFVPKTMRPTSYQPPSPLQLDLSSPSPIPILLASGAQGGLGNPHFVSRETPRPKYATKGQEALYVTLSLELKVLADVGLVGLPNAGKSTLLRSLTRSRTRVGDWAFTTLQPHIGTVVLDDHTGRPALEALARLPAAGRTPERRTQFSIADIPGLVEDAHLDKGLGLGFLRHVERANVLCFVVDLSAPGSDAVAGLVALWREVAEYEAMRARELSADTERRIGNVVRIDYSHHGGVAPSAPAHYGDVYDIAGPPPPITSKPWFVVATKADQAGTEENFERLRAYVERVDRGEVEHPSGRPNAWRRGVKVVPVSAIRAEGVQRIPRIVVDLLAA